MYRVPLYSTKGKRTLITSSKLYSVDTGLRNSYRNFNVSDRGSLLENVVFIELLRRGYEVYVVKIKNDKEVDFVAINGLERIYIQVCDNLNTTKLLDREINNLRLVNDNKEKIVLVLDGDNYETEDGIKIINLID
jgi:predicted AAA+ superfamily ATPase